MARMYFNFNTNLPNTTPDHVFAAVDYIAFTGRNGEIISVSCNMDSDWYVKKRVYKARFKGLEVKVEGLDENEDVYRVHDYEEMSLEDFALLQNATPYEIGFQEEDNLPDIIECKNINIRIEFFTDREIKSLEFRANSLGVM